jgi:hypothetical protein
MTAFTAGDRVSVARYHGAALGVVRTAMPGWLTVDMDDDNHLPGGAHITLDLSRHTVRLVA